MSLAEHRIKEVKAGEVRNLIPRLIGKNAKLIERGYGFTTGAVILTTDTGYMGWGLGNADRSLKLSLEGKKVSDVFSPDIGILDLGYSEADVALHDLAGKILGISVSKMVNPESTMAASCYDGAIYMDELRDGKDLGIDPILKHCRDDYERGFVDFKIKLGRGYMWMEKEAGLKRDIEVVRAIRREFPDAKIMVDFNDGSDLETVKRFVAETADCKLYWIEEPFRENYENCMALKKYLKEYSPGTLLADGEFKYDRNEIIPLAEQGAVDVLLMDINSFVFTEWRHIIKLCKEKGLNFKCSPHAWGVGVKTRVAAHLAAAFPEICPTVEGLPDVTEGVDYSGYTLKNGIMSIEDRPGFGMDLEFARPVEIFKPY